MFIFIRFIWILLGTAAGISIFAVLFELLNALPHLLAAEAETAGSQIFGTVLWSILFRMAGLVLFATLPLTLLLCVLERCRVRHAIAYVLVWLVAGSVPYAALYPPAGIIAAVVSGGAAGWLYWATVVRPLDWWTGYTETVSHAGLRKVFSIAAYLAFAFIAFHIAGYAVHGGRLLWASAISNPDMGTPPFKLVRGKLSAEQKLALNDFPDAASCLLEGTAGVSPESATRMDWSRIENKGEAEVCIFRLLKTHGEISGATKWFGAQGFSTPDGFSSANPYVEQDKTLRVSASYSIAENGPKFPEKGFFRRKLASIAYAMNINSYWSKDGSELLGVTIDFSIL